MNITNGFSPNINPSLEEQSLILSGAVAAMSFGFLLTAAVPIFPAISNARPGVLSIFFPTFLVAEPKCLKKSPNPTPFFV